MRNVEYFNIRKPISPIIFENKITGNVVNDIGYIFSLKLKEFYSFCCEAEKKKENKESVNQAIEYSFKLFRDNLEKDKNK